MTVDQIIQMISTVGFPIVCCGALFWYMIKESNSHKEEVTKITEAVNNNTLMLQKLCDKLDRE